MSIETLCPNCGYQNLLYIDELMGKYALCDNCRTLFKFRVTNSEICEQERDNKLISGQNDSK